MQYYHRTMQPTMVATSNINGVHTVIAAPSLFLLVEVAVSGEGVPKPVLLVAEIDDGEPVAVVFARLYKAVRVTYKSLTNCTS
jgi:hypothetical protein